MTLKPIVSTFLLHIPPFNVGWWLCSSFLCRCYTSSWPISRTAMLRSPVPRSVRTHFQVRKVRVLFSSLFGTVYALIVDCMVGSVVLMCEGTLHVLFGRKTWLLQWRTVARPVNLAQSSQSRLSEMKQGARLGLLRERSPRRPAQRLSERAPRPGERGLA